MDKEEAEFQKIYGKYAKQYGLNKNPDDPNHHYDYRAAIRAGHKPDKTGHWPSVYKEDAHPDRFIRGVDTKTGIKPNRNRRFGKD